MVKAVVWDLGEVLITGPKVESFLPDMLYLSGKSYRVIIKKIKGERKCLQYSIFS